MATSRKTEVAKVEEQERSVLLFDPSVMAEVLRSALSPGEKLDVFALPIVKIPPAGALYWQLPDGPPAQTLSGVIIARQPVRAYWQHACDEGGGGAPPDCSSMDSLYGVGDPGGDCSECPLNVFGSGKDNGKACRQITRLFVLTEGNMLPVLMPLPPSAFKACQRYVWGLAAKVVTAWQVQTSISLRQEKSSTGIVYSMPVFAQGATLDAADRKAIAEYRNGLLPLLTAMPLAEEPV